MSMSMRTVLASCVVVLGISTLSAKENPAGFTRRVEVGSQSALLTQTVENGSASYTIAYEKVTLDDGDIMVKHCTRDRDCVIAPVSGGKAVPFGSKEGLQLIRQIAEKKSAVPANPVVAAERQLQANLKSADEKIGGISVTDFDTATREALVSPEPALASFAPSLAPAAPASAFPTPAVPARLRKISREPGARFPVTLDVGAGWGKKISALGRNSETNEVEWQDHTPAAFTTRINVPVAPIQDHGYGHIEAGFGGDITWIGKSETSYANVDPKQPGPGIYDYTVVSHVGDGRRQKTWLWEPFRLVYESPRVASLSGYVGGGLVVGRNDQRLITNDNVTTDVNTCTQIVSINGVPDHCGAYNTNSTTVNTHTVYQGGVVNHTGAGHSFTAGVKVKAGYWASLYTEFTRSYFGQKFDTFKVGVNFRLWPNDGY